MLRAPLKMNIGPDYFEYEAMIPGGISGETSCPAYCPELMHLKHLVHYHDTTKAPNS